MRDSLQALRKSQSSRHSLLPCNAPWCRRVVRPGLGPVPSPTSTWGGMASASGKTGLFTMLLSLGLAEGEGIRQGGKGPSFHPPTHTLKNLSKRLSGITLVKLIIIITRTQSRKKKIYICFVTKNIHFLHSGLLSKQWPSQNPGETEAWDGDMELWTSQCGSLARL